MATLQMETMNRAPQDLKSPLPKLVRFFQRSRNRWKVKYLGLKREHKLMGNQVRAVEKSREKWRRDAQQAQQQLRQLQQELAEYQKSVAV